MAVANQRIFFDPVRHRLPWRRTIGGVAHSTRPPRWLTGWYPGFRRPDFGNGCNTHAPGGDRRRPSFPIPGDRPHHWTAPIDGTPGGLLGLARFAGHHLGKFDPSGRTRIPADGIRRMDWNACRYLDLRVPRVHFGSSLRRRGRTAEPSSGAWNRPQDRAPVIAHGGIAIGPSYAYPRHRRPAERRQVDAVQSPHPDAGSAGRRLSGIDPRPALRPRPPRRALVHRRRHRRLRAGREGRHPARDGEADARGDRRGRRHRLSRRRAYGR